MRLSALESLQRGLLNLRGNWQLVPISWVLNLVSLLLSVLALLPFYLVLDIDWPASDLTPDQASVWMMESMERLMAQVLTPAFWLAMISSSALLLALLAVYSFVQGAIYAVLSDGDRLAPRSGVAAGSFRSFNWQEFQRHGGHYLWRFFWLFNVVFILWLVLVLVISIAFVLIAMVGAGAGVPAAVALGCAAFFPFVFLVVLLGFWTLIAQAEIADRDCSLGSGMRSAFRIVGRRLGAIVVLALVFGAAFFAVSLVFLTFALSIEMGLAMFERARFVTNLMMQVVQGLASAILYMVVAATVVALSRAERAQEATD